MSVREMAWALEQRDIDPLHKFVLLALADNSHDGEVSINAVHLSKYTNIDPWDIQNAINGLKCAGKISVIGDTAFLSCSPAQRPAARPTKKPIPSRLRFAVFARDGYRCLRCGCDNEHLLRADHVVPESKGGEASIENLQTLCHSCNSWKGTKTIDFRGVEA